MNKRSSYVLLAVCLLNLLILVSMVLNQRTAKAATKHVYKFEIVGGSSINVQSMLDERASQGWRLVSASGYPFPNGSNTEAITALIFEKE